ncbi:hypothetical protein ABT009_25945 [Streptomyces sp. NPDC002896]|uniref:hypothetical protein n=1 Tax=Streptomyces sp. NPDC002896 TaxID=3154438 RepID=UPI00331BB3C7
MAKRVRQVLQAQRAKTARETAQLSRVAARARGVVRRLRTLTGRQITVTATALVVVAAVAVAGFLVFRDDGRPPIPDTRARHYTEVDACLLTGKKGITAGTTAAEVWQGMQDASLKTHARVSYVPVTGEQSAANARPYLNGLLQRSCDVVLATGGPEVKAAAEAAPQYRKVGFVLVGAGAERGGSARPRNVTVTKTGDGLRADVAGAVERAVDAQE